MQSKGTEMDRRTFVKAALAAGAGLALSTSLDDLVWGSYSPDGDLADRPLVDLAKLIQNGAVGIIEYPLNKVI